MKRCEGRCPIEHVRETPDETRPGWLRGVCGVCGTFLGYREKPLHPSETKPSKRASRK